MLTIDLDRLALTPGRRLLDVGCGAGRHTYAALRRGATTVAFDLDDTALKDTAALAQAVLQQEELPPGASAAAVRGDALNLPFADGCFDRIVASEVLEHIPDDRQVLAEIARVLAPGGRAAISVPRMWPEAVCWALSRQYHNTPGSHVRIYARSRLIRRMAEAGLVVDSRHHAHALHSPYWWLRCAVGPNDDEHVLVRTYKTLLERQIVEGSPRMDALERTLDPLLGKSLVVYADKTPNR